MATVRGILGVVLIAICVMACGGEKKADGPVPSMLSTPTRSPGSSGANAAPVVDHVELRPGNPTAGRTVRVVASVSDEDGDATRVRYEWRTSSGRVLAQGRSFNTQGLDEGDRLEVVVTATDGVEDSAPFIHEFRIAESSLEIAHVAIDYSRGLKPGSVLQAIVESTNENRGGYEILFEWIVDGKIVGNGNELDTTRLAPGDYVLLKARFEFSDSMTRPVSSAPVRLERGQAPNIGSEPRVGVAGGVFRYQIQATSEEPGAQLSYQLLAGPDGMTVDVSSGRVLWRPSEDQRGSFAIEVAVKDQWGSGTAQAFRIEVDAETSPPARSR